MIVTIASIDCDELTDWQTFHAVFARELGFPGFYGRNMNAWIDCMTSLDEPEDGLTAIHCEAGKVLTLELTNVRALRERCPHLYDAIVECSAFVNWRRAQVGMSSVLALSFHR